MDVTKKKKLGTCQGFENTQKKKTQWFKDSAKDSTYGSRAN